VNPVDIDPDHAGGFFATLALLDAVELPLLNVGFIVIKDRDLDRFCSSFAYVNGSTGG
jgi:hypothetical protein